jgi:hypothetical protein
LLRSRMNFVVHGACVSDHLAAGGDAFDAFVREVAESGPCTAMYSSRCS